MSFIIPIDGLQEKFQQEFVELRKSLERPNILLLGQTGVGKSSLVNVVFGEEVAKVSDTKPETRGFHVFSTPMVPVNIIDSEGYELSDPEKFRQVLDEFIESNFNDIKTQVHIAWYCISISSNRVLPYDLKNIKFLLDKKIPTCVVFTQCDNDTPEGDKAKALNAVLTHEFGRKLRSFQTSNDTSLNKELDIDKLIDWSMNNLNNDNLKLAFLIAQKANLEIKRDEAQSRIKYYAALAGGIGASPIPMSDAVLLTGLQVQMASDIFSIYGLDNNFSNVIKNIISGRIVSMLGKMVAGNLIKMIPGIGSGTGAAINAAVATTITYSMGYALTVLAYKAIETCFDLPNEQAAKVISEIFSEENFNRLINEYEEQKVK